MSATEHTRGPLEVAVARAGSALVEYFVRRPGDDVAVCAEVIDPETGEPSKANATLFAAAPAMVETLQEIRSRLTPRTGGVKIDRAGVVALCEAALKKAGVIP